jgi:SM-20-related protein
MYENLYEKIADALVNDGYAVIEDALDTKLPQELLSTVEQTPDMRPAGVSSSAVRDENRRRDKIKWLDADVPATKRYLDFTAQLQNYLNRTLFLGLRYYEAHFAVYEAGDFYEKHLDAFKNSKNRIVTTVYYLNETWNTEYGGELVIYNKQDEAVQKVLPKANTLVVFMSEDFPHEVLPTKVKRSSIAGWFRIDEKIIH